jgi:plastocyanin
MLDQIWTNFLDFTAQFVTPDWGKLIFLMPVAIVLAAVLVLLWVFAKLARAKPARRGMRRLPPKSPADVHMPGPSFAPVFAAVGVFLVLLGLVVGGITIVLGLIALVLTLVYWLAEGMRNYDHDIGPTTTTALVAAHDGPPPGVHMPGPSWRPFLGAFGLFAVMLGLVFGGWVLAAGVIALVSTLIGWLFDAVAEYRQTVKADTTGHLENIPEPKSPRRLLSVLTVLIVGAAVLQSGIFVGSNANGGTGAPGASGAPSGSGAPAGSGAPGGSGGPPPASGAAADVSIQAKGVAYVETTFTAPAGKPFTIAFDNEDAGTPHNIEILDASGGTAFKGDIFPGVATKIYNVPALPAGSYKFLCIVHPTIMTGTATVQ